MPHGLVRLFSSTVSVDRIHMRVAKNNPGGIVTETESERSTRQGRIPGWISSPTAAIVRAHLFHKKLVKLGGGKYGQLAQGEALNRAHFSRVLRLAYLAP